MEILLLNDRFNLYDPTETNNSISKTPTRAMLISIPQKVFINYITFYNYIVNSPVRHPNTISMYAIHRQNDGLTRVFRVINII